MQRSCRKPLLQRIFFAVFVYWGQINPFLSEKKTNTFENLTELECVDIRERDMVKAVASLCRKLNIIEFDSTSSGICKGEDVITPDELDSILNAQQSFWPEVFAQNYTKLLLFTSFNTMQLRRFELWQLSAYLLHTAIFCWQKLELSCQPLPWWVVNWLKWPRTWDRAVNLVKLVIRETCTMAPIDTASGIQITTDRCLI